METAYSRVVHSRLKRRRVAPTTSAHSSVSACRQATVSNQRSLDSARALLVSDPLVVKQSCRFVDFLVRNLKKYHLGNNVQCCSKPRKNMSPSFRDAEGGGEGGALDDDAVTPVLAVAVALLALVAPFSSRN